MAAQNEKKNKKRKGWSGFWLFFHYLAKSSVLEPWHAMVLRKIGKTKQNLIEFILFQKIVNFFLYFHNFCIPFK